MTESQTETRHHLLLNPSIPILMDFSVSQDINFFAYGLDSYHLQQKKDLLTKSQKWFNLYIKKIFTA